MTPVYTVSVTVFMEAYKYVWACNYLKSKSKPSRDIFRGDVLLKTQSTTDFYLPRPRNFCVAVSVGSLPPCFQDTGQCAGTGQVL